MDGKFADAVLGRFEKARVQLITAPEVVGNCGWSWRRSKPNPA